VDGVDILIDREPDGTIPLLKKFTSATPAQPAPRRPPKKDNAAPQPLNLEPPLRIDAVRVSHVTTRLRDRSVTPVFDATVRTTLRGFRPGLHGSPRADGTRRRRRSGARYAAR